MTDNLHDMSGVLIQGHTPTHDPDSTYCFR